MVTQVDTWNPTQYEKFRDQRKLPFYDLLAMIQPRPGMRVIDLGCGTGELTAELAERLPDAAVEGVDSSTAMLEQAAARAGGRVSFRQQDIAAIEDFSGYDLVFSNAALQWLPDNEGLMARMLGTMGPGAQIAVQVPKNNAHPSHRIAAELAESDEFRERLTGASRATLALAMERYAELMWEHGLSEQVCYEKIYGHVLPNGAAVIEWVKGTLLTGYFARLDDAGRERFLEVYRGRLLAEIGERAPYFYPFRRLLFWGMRA